MMEPGKCPHLNKTYKQAVGGTKSGNKNHFKLKRAAIQRLITGVAYIIRKKRKLQPPVT